MVLLGAEPPEEVPEVSVPVCCLRGDNKAGPRSPGPSTAHNIIISLLFFGLSPFRALFSCYVVPKADGFPRRARGWCTAGCAPARTSQVMPFRGIASAHCWVCLRMAPSLPHSQAANEGKIILEPGGPLVP